jgi:hypothetical protein
VGCADCSHTITTTVISGIVAVVVVVISCMLLSRPLEIGVNVRGCCTARRDTRRQCCWSKALASATAQCCLELNIRGLGHLGGIRACTNRWG